MAEPNDGGSDLTAASWWTVNRSHEPHLTRGATPLIERCIRTYRWTEAFALKVLEGYKQFLTWKHAFEDWNATTLSPSLPVDQMWHQHLLDNKNYADDCELLFGRVVYHDPDGGLDVEARKDRVSNTKEAIRMRFGEDYDRQVWDFGGDADIHARRSNKRAHSLEASRAVSPTDLLPTENDLVRFFIVDSSGPPLLFKKNRASPLAGAFWMFARHRQVDESKMRFVFRCRSVKAHETPEMLELGHDDVIEASRVDQTDSSRSDTVTFRLKDHHGEQFFFKIKRTTRLKKVFSKFAQLKGLDVDDFRFFLDGERVCGQENAATLELLDDDQIDVMPGNQTGC